VTVVHVFVQEILRQRFPVQGCLWCDIRRAAQ